MCQFNLSSWRFYRKSCMLSALKSQEREVVFGNSNRDSLLNLWQHRKGRRRVPHRVVPDTHEVRERQQSTVATVAKETVINIYTFGSEPTLLSRGKKWDSKSVRLQAFIYSKGIFLRGIFSETKALELQWGGRLAFQRAVGKHCRSLTLDAWAQALPIQSRENGNTL